MNEVNARRARLVLGWVTSRQILDGHVGATAAEKLEGTSRGVDADSLPSPLSPSRLPLLLHPCLTHSLPHILLSFWR